ncbi:hypothetical protein niasHS_011151 [Heterodera schachtii]|uniref:Protein kinase domain-containing protein n=1 Tax=Heterodera schachtii TaxID=97005 RepID=A0ABD2ITN6_HETSC
MATKAFQHPKDQLLDEQCKYLFRMANEMKDDEQRFNFVHGHISAVEDGMKEGEHKKKIVKSMASWALKEFNAKEKFKTDLRMLDFWKLLGKYSKDLKMEGVMENLHRVGHFNAQPAFYLMWAEHWAALNNRANFDKILAMCESNCNVNAFECVELFRPLSSKYFGESSDETDTVALIKVIADRPEDVRRTLTMFPAKLQEQQQHHHLHVSPRDELPEEQQQPNPLPTCREEFPQEQQQPLPVCREEFSIFRDPAKSMICCDLDDITLAGAHGKFAHTVFTSTPRRSVAFCAFEPPMMEMDNDGLMGPSPSEDREERVGGLFAPVPETGVSKLQRRLSLVGDFPTHAEKGSQSAKNTGGKKMTTNDIVKALPNLKIGSTIMEETEEEEKENSFASPHRKKARQGTNASHPPSLVHSSKQTSQLNDASHNQPKAVSAQTPAEEGQPDPDVTHLGIVEQIKTGTENPWDEEKRNQILQTAHVMVESHAFMTEKCPRFELNRTIHLGGESFSIEDLLGQGGFARVYRANSRENGCTYAIKYESPACPWEVYICSALKRRIPSQFAAYLMEVRDAYIFKNASAIVYEYFPKGTLLDLTNVYKKNGTVVGGLLATFFGVHLARALRQVHETANIIHADVKPDNVMLLTAALNVHDSLDNLLKTPVLKLIDWGRSIDMNHFQGVEFHGKAGTENFDCVEMKTGMPWTFQTDFYGFCATMYVMMNGEYLVTFKYSQTDKVVPVKQLKRRMALYDVWTQLFDQYLNIPNCKQLPKWLNTLDQMESRLAEAVKTEPLEWKRAIERFNEFVKQRG